MPKWKFGVGFDAALAALQEVQHYFGDAVRLLEDKLGRTGG